MEKTEGRKGKHHRANAPANTASFQVPHPIVGQQMGAPQPPIWLLVGAYFISAYGLTLLTKGLMEWPAFVKVVANHHDLYFQSFFGLQMACMIAAAVFVSWQYRSAVWRPKPPSWGKPVTVTLVMVIPLAAYHFKDMNAMNELLETATRSGRLPMDLIDRLFFRIWGRLPYGPTLTGVWCSTILGFTAPIWEEILFSGCVLNRIAQRWGIWTGIVATAVLFSLGHAVQFGIGMHLVGLFAAGLTYAAIRGVTGSLGMAIAAHLLINGVIYLPKWMMAWIHFRNA